MATDLQKKFAAEKKESYYESWVRGEGLERISGHYIPDLRKVELRRWERVGGNAVVLNHEESNHSNDCYVVEIAPGSKLKAKRQLFEEVVYILDGRGSTKVWNEAGKRASFEWQAGSLFAIPINA